ncbi:MAG TPA: MFS transporter [Solirubrobacteraceae bacterium]|nr:MFS transporter [Solirubrobacteraceae bacterium]
MPEAEQSAAAAAAARPTDPAVVGAQGSPNRLSPLRFVLAFGVVSLLADFVYEGARSIVGPYLATLGASAALVGFITGAGEAVALVFRLFSGRVSDRSGRHWALSISGYVITVVAVPVLAAAQVLWQASVLVVAERFGKAVRTPARDTMLSHAGVSLGRGWAFAVHEAMDQSGALLGPLLVALMTAISGYRLGFGVLAVPGVLALLALAWLRRAAPSPALYAEEPAKPTAARPVVAGPGPARLGGFSGRFWLYSAFTALSMAGFATFGVLGYHLQVRHVVAPAVIPVIYAVAMGADAVASIFSGRAYDRVGLRVLLVAPVLAAIVPFLSFSRSPALVWIGGAVWGAAFGVHESTLRAAVADLVPPERRGTGYGTFTAVYGLAWLAGGTIIGVLYAQSVQAVIWFTLALQALALLALLPLLSRRGA